MEAATGVRGHRVQNPERADQRRRDILLAAGRIFIRDGYQRATLNEIAAQAGVTKGVIYYYFRGKEEILTAIRVTAIDASIERLTAIVERADPPRLKLEAAIRDLAVHIFDDLDRYSILIRGEEHTSVETRSLVRPRQQHYRALIRGILEAGIREGVFIDHDPRLTTLALLQPVLGIVRWYQPGGPTTKEQIIDQVTRQVLRGVLVDPTAGTDAPPLSTT